MRRKTVLFHEEAPVFHALDALRVGHDLLDEHYRLLDLDWSICVLRHGHFSVNLLLLAESFGHSNWQAKFGDQKDVVRALEQRLSRVRKLDLVAGFIIVLKGDSALLLLEDGCWREVEAKIKHLVGSVVVLGDDGLANNVVKHVRLPVLSSTLVHRLDQ